MSLNLCLLCSYVFAKIQFKGLIMMIYPIVSIQYLPSISYFKTLLEYDSFCLDAHEHFQKGSYRNRCHIATASGLFPLSIPLQKGKNQQQPIRETRIAYDQNWQKQHWWTIRSAYSNAPYWEHYADIFETFYVQKPVFLWDYNLMIFENCLKMLKIQNKVVLKNTEQYFMPFEGVLESENIKYVDFRSKIHPKRMVLNSKHYPQIFEAKNGFLPDLSILDLIFCCGGQYGRELLTT
jgi:WbqC-like protein family